ncbi:MAG: gamma carbonic anhydrase family protein [Bacteroidales bacterium]|nr:gamma carbonic anhydrase family protein [Bacteroidales bacterium]
MAIIRELRGFTPKIGKNCFIAENAVIIGDVEIGDDCSIWYGVVLRGDVNTIKIGNRVNIQDNASVHTLYQRSVTIIGDDVSVGHNAVVHGAKVGNDVLVGMGAILMDNAEIADGSIIAAGAVVLSNEKLEPGVYAGVPAKKVKDGSEAITAAAHRNAQGYMMYKTWYESPSESGESQED